MGDGLDLYNDANWRHLEGDEASVKRYLMTDAYKERSPKDESKKLLKVAATRSVLPSIGRKTVSAPPKRACLAPLLGTLVIPNNDPAQARVDVSPFGRTLTNLLWDISKYQPDIQMLHYALMPDHLHFIWYVKRPLTRSIREVVSGFWVGAKTLGRAYSYNDSSFALTIGQSPIP